VKTDTKRWSNGGIQISKKSPTHMQTVCCFDIPTVSKAEGDWLLNMKISHGTRS
jgi:hypothetical protein